MRCLLAQVSPITRVSPIAPVSPIRTGVTYSCGDATQAKSYSPDPTLFAFDRCFHLRFSPSRSQRLKIAASSRPVAFARSFANRDHVFTFARSSHRVTPHSHLSPLLVRRSPVAIQARHPVLRHAVPTLSLRHTTVDHRRSPAIPDAFHYDRPSLKPRSTARTVL